MLKFKMHDKFIEHLIDTFRHFRDSRSILGLTDRVMEREQEETGRTCFSACTECGEKRRLSHYSDFVMKTMLQALQPCA